MGATITLHVGQCGNQIGAEFWDRICAEHGISFTGEVDRVVEEDRKDAFFYESCDGRFFPRSILVDLEPRVVSSVLQARGSLFSSERIWVSSEGGGAGNVWARGYERGRENAEALLDTIQREAEGTDLLSGFILFHSVGGGTGSGLGSFLLEEVKDLMGKKSIQAVSVFPNNEEISDAVVQPYNVVLTLRRLRECADGVVAMDNGALARAVSDALKASVSFAHTNRHASGVIAAETGPVRFPGSRFTDLSTLLAMSSPLQGCHFLVPSYIPSNYARRTTCADLQRRLFLPKTQLVTFEESESNCLLSAISIMHGASLEEAEKGLCRLRRKSGIRFAPGVPASVQMGLCRVPESGRTGLLLSNTTGFAQALQKNISQYDRLRKRNAFLDMYRKESADIEEELDLARESVQNLIDAYRQAELSESAE